LRAVTSGLVPRILLSTACQNAIDKSPLPLRACFIWEGIPLRPRILAVLITLGTFIQVLLACKYLSQPTATAEQPAPAADEPVTMPANLTPVAKVSIIRHGKYIHLEEPKKVEATLTFTDRSPNGAKTSYYFVGIEQSDWRGCRRCGSPIKPNEITGPAVQRSAPPARRT
jgi:hypothetical protein